jgi:hypothetical protein
MASAGFTYMLDRLKPRARSTHTNLISLGLIRSQLEPRSVVFQANTHTITLSMQLVKKGLTNESKKIYCGNDTISF